MENVMVLFDSWMQAEWVKEREKPRHDVGEAPVFLLQTASAGVWTKQYFAQAKKAGPLQDRL
jgi:hypothetical protein